MPLPTTDEGLIVGGIIGSPGATLQDIFDRLQTVIDVLRQTNVVPSASLLVSEFFNREDLDSGAGSGDSPLAFPPPNNSIYGTLGGFQLDEADTNFPITLESVHLHERFEFPSITITFAQYLATLP